MVTRVLVPQWEIGFEGCKWWTLDLGLCQFIQNAKNKGHNIVEYTWESPGDGTSSNPRSEPCKTYEINFDTMIRTNKHNGRKRSVRVIWREQPVTGFDWPQYDGRWT